ncbi:PREDICTED: leucine-rich repeat receptor-like serine/threonine-protein kinase At1g17230 [Tarenaya hassleriana]|uniref:leucine-rich repeat receptor-like serine/threonine-protein kinase At1g17230 n=1 Tax=Tarenaya hassleriana TaxID=28532 RepID=UPI00053C77E7|nr:PREDICTED: leucine-rich repeat receptor-like serine/threonine-protein kinase At1g17230 [Tarenaya hassleriana]
MFFHRLLLSCIFTIFLMSSSVISLPLSASYLLQFFHSLPLQSQELLPWKQQSQTSSSSSSPCHWYGVSCFSNGLTVKSLNLSGLGLVGFLTDSFPYLCLHDSLFSLDLSGNGFTGPVPRQLPTCSKLTVIRLNDNRFQGSVPAEIFLSDRISTLDFGRNSLSGEIPREVSSCTNLEYLGLYDNFLTGDIPVEVLSLPKLKHLFLNTNNLTGSLPGFPPSCQLLDLWVHENQLVGTLPVTLSNCRNLTSFIASGNGIGGQIPAEMFKGLWNLQLLYLDGNRLEGSIPDTLWDLENLEELVLSGNKLNGSIPDRISQSHQLSVVALSSNKLTGEIPRTVGELVALNYLLLFDNMLTGSLPRELGNCSSLVELRLQNNYIGGSIPREIGKLEQLRVLLLFNNRIRGSIPAEIGNMTGIEQLALYNNSLTGTVPYGVTLLKKLRFLSLAHNNLSGALPSSLGKDSPRLEKLDLSSNSLCGPIPSGLCSGNRLSVLVLGDNRFNGSFPAEIAECPSLRRVILSNNLLQGNISENLGKESGIETLNLGGNLLGGLLPSAFGHWRNLSMLDLSRNKFSGPIPHEFGQLVNLQVLRLSSNRLTGELPSELSRCAMVIDLDLSKNCLSGSIPPEILTSFGKLQSLFLQENRLRGVLPDTFASLENLIELQLGDNMFEGPIPCSLSELQHFSLVLNLSNNRLSGEIPPCLGKMNKLQILDLSRNNLRGKIPEEMNNMVSLEYANVSSNHLSGGLPLIWTRIAARHPGCFFGNPELCLLGNKAGDCESLHKRGNKTRNLLAGLIGLGVSVCVLCVVLYILVSRHLKGNRYYNLHLPVDCQSKTEDLPDDMTLEDLMRATEGWSDKYVIGRGKHGTVYRTESTKSRKNWAVKKVNLSEADFDVEKRTLSLVKHRNVVRMTGYCIKDGFGFILTEYMPRGTLFNALHRSEPPISLDWRIRYRIALGIANGLAYLHHDCVPQIIHRDVKSDNILLDSEFEPKIGDFGTARLVHQSDETSSARSVIVGTLGYIAPENAYSTYLTEKCDVYSYGVILLELLCRKLPVDPSFEEGLDIVSWTKLNLLEDEEPIGFFDKEISHWVGVEQEKALGLLELALQCTEQTAESRPSMRDVLRSLMKL